MVKQVSEGMRSTTVQLDGSECRVIFSVCYPYYEILNDTKADVVASSYEGKISGADGAITIHSGSSATLTNMRLDVNTLYISGVGTVQVVGKSHPESIFRVAASTTGTGGTGNGGNGGDNTGGDNTGGDNTDPDNPTNPDNPNNPTDPDNRFEMLFGRTGLQITIPAILELNCPTIVPAIADEIDPNVKYLIGGGGIGNNDLGFNLSAQGISQFLKPFDKDSSSVFSPYNRTTNVASRNGYFYVGYKFDKAVKMKALAISQSDEAYVLYGAMIQYSTDGTNWLDLFHCNFSFTRGSYYYAAINAGVSAPYWRIRPAYNDGDYVVAGPFISELQFYCI